jgi:cell division protein FtsQ
LKLKKIIQRLLFFLLWVGIATGMTFLLMAAIGQRNKERFRSYTIEIQGSYGSSFLTSDSVANLLQSHTAGVRGELLSLFNMQQVESKLQLHPWIRRAQLYFDNQDVLHVRITEKLPIARVFTNNGASSYLDENGHYMPLSASRTLKLPVFTGLPDSVDATKADSVLLLQMRNMAQVILADSFWNAQVAQVDWTPEGSWELIPLVGDQVVRLGQAQDFLGQLRKLFIFYKQVLAKTGFNRYRTIDLRFDNQVIAGYGAAASVDSIQLRRSVQQLLLLSRQADMDTTIRYLPKPLQPLLKDDTLAVTTELKNSLPIDTSVRMQQPTKKINN